MYVITIEFRIMWEILLQLIYLGDYPINFGTKEIITVLLKYTYNLVELRNRIYHMKICKDGVTKPKIERFCHCNGLDWSLLVKHLVIGDIHNSWLYCFTNPIELGTRVSLAHRQLYVWTYGHVRIYTRCPIERFCIVNTLITVKVHKMNPTFNPKVFNSSVSSLKVLLE